MRGVRAELVLGLFYLWLVGDVAEWVSVDVFRQNSTTLDRDLEAVRAM